MGLLTKPSGMPIIARREFSLRSTMQRSFGAFIPFSAQSVGRTYPFDTGPIPFRRVLIPLVARQAALRLGKTYLKRQALYFAS